MLAEALRAMYGYNRWATKRVMEVAAQLTPEQWLAPGNAGRGSVRDTMVHLIAAQRRWLAWWDGSLPADQALRSQLNPADHPNLASVRAAWETLDRATQAFVDGLTDADVERVYSTSMPNGTLFRQSLWQMMLHVVNHGTQHRSEVAAMLTGFGHSPGDLDLLGYFRLFSDGKAT